MALARMAPPFAAAQRRWRWAARQRSKSRPGDVRNGMVLNSKNGELTTRNRMIEAAKIMIWPENDHESSQQWCFQPQICE